MPQQQLRVQLHIPKEEYLRVYRGSARVVYAQSADGRKVQFPVNILTPFVSHDGLHGEFIISYDENGKFKSIEKVG